MYSPKDPPTLTTLEELRDFVTDELGFIAQELSKQNLLWLNPVARAPDKPRDGMLVFADGTNFNPGAGAGTYEYRGGAWHKL
jgi:hypothetical protein